MSEKLKNIENLERFKREIKTWKPDNCPCRLCKVYIESLGFLSFPEADLGLLQHPSWSAL